MFIRKNDNKYFLSFLLIFKKESFVNKLFLDKYYIRE